MSQKHQEHQEHRDHQDLREVFGEGEVHVLPNGWRVVTPSPRQRRRSRWHRSPLYWAWRQTRETLWDEWDMLDMTDDMGISERLFFTPPCFCALLTIACLARLPFHWGIVQAADAFVRETGEYA